MPTRTPLPATAHLPPQTTHPASQTQASAATDALSVILVTGSYDGTVRYWEAWSGICSRTLQTQDHVSSSPLSFSQVYAIDWIRVDHDVAQLTITDFFVDSNRTNWPFRQTNDF